MEGVRLIGNLIVVSPEVWRDKRRREAPPPPPAKPAS